MCVRVHVSVGLYVSIGKSVWHVCVWLCMRVAYIRTCVSVYALRAYVRACVIVRCVHKCVRACVCHTCFCVRRHFFCTSLFLFLHLLFPHFNWCTVLFLIPLESIINYVMNDFQLTWCTDMSFVCTMGALSLYSFAFKLQYLVLVYESRILS